MNRRLILAAVAGTCFLPLACAPGTQLSPPASGLVISDVTVVSPERAAPLEHAYVRIVEGQIADMSDRPLHGEREIDGTGRYLTPGLVDGHVHLAVPPGFPAAMTAAQAAAHPGVVAATLAQDPRSYLFFGFTTVVDLVGSAERTAQWNALDRRPDAFFCGAAVIIDGRTRSVRYPYFSYGVPFAEQIAPAVPPAQSTPEAVVARIAADRAICVKTIHDRGLEPTVEEGRALVAAAHAHDLPVLIHANRKRSQAFAVAAGMDVIVHGMWRDPDEDAALDDDAREILAAIARQRIGYQPTTQVIASLLDLLATDYLVRPELADVYPAPFTDWCAREEACHARRNDAVDPGIEGRLQGTIGRATEVTRILAEANARLLFGSDTPSEMTHTNPPGLNGRLEMNHWIAAGVSDETLFRALTLDNARAFGLDDRIGTVEPGKVANLLLLNANPLESVTAYDTIETVFLHGEPIARGELSARSAVQ